MKRWRSIIAIAIIILLVLGMVTTIVSSITAYAESVSDMQSELDSIIAKREKLEKELKKIKDNKNEAMAEKAIVDEQISSLEKEEELLRGVLDGLENELEASQAELETAESDLSEYSDLAKNRIRSMYELGSTSYVSIVLNSESIHDFTSRYDVIKQIMESNHEMIDNLTEKKNHVQQVTKGIEEKKNAQEEALTSLENNVSALEKKREHSDALIDKFNQQTNLNIKAIQDAERAEEKLQDEIRQAMAQSGNTDFVGGKWLWPVNGYYTITSKFGMRTHPITGVYKLHTGVDISGYGINKKPIRAANGGKVIKAGYNTGYGNYVVIDHGGGYSTLYGHATKLYVRAGQTVNRGDTIAIVGSTGYSTGAHLHFEIIKNGNYTNPLSYYNINFKYS